MENTKTGRTTKGSNRMSSLVPTSRHPRMAIRSPNLPNPSQDAILGPDRSLAKSLSRELAADRIRVIVDTPRGTLSADEIHRLYALHTEDAR